MRIKERIQKLEERLKGKAPFRVALIRPVEGGFTVSYDGKDFGMFPTEEEARRTVAGASIIVTIERVGAERRNECEGAPETD